MSNKYRVVVDGTAYTVEVESLGAGAALSAPVAAPLKSTLATASITAT